jgi:hypothetical protein
MAEEKWDIGLARHQNLKLMMPIKTSGDLVKKIGILKSSSNQC